MTPQEHEQIQISNALVAHFSGKRKGKNLTALKIKMALVAAESNATTEDKILNITNILS